MASGPPFRLNRALARRVLAAANAKDAFVEASHGTFCKRTSTTLTNADLMRGTTTACLLECFGRRLRSTAGGIGTTASDAENEYDKSFPLNELDVFLSHSWHGNWFLKYLILLFHFNVLPAVIASISSVLVIFLILLRITPSTNAEPADCWSLENTKDYGVCLPVGYTTLLVFLMLWHQAKSTTIFLDKVCIHQTDAYLKQRGILSLGAILKNTRTLLVAYDSSYFERLWCTYELSAFRFARPNGRIQVLPLHLGGFVLCCFLVSAVVNIIKDMGVSHYTGVKAGSHSKSNWKQFTSTFGSAMLYFLPLLLSMPQMRRYMRGMRKIRRHLASFSVRKSKCFCCTVNHVIPATGKRIPCDRRLVYNSIAHWHGEGDEAKGLDAFDAIIRGEFAEYMATTLGGWSQVPYSHAVFIGIPYFLRFIDYVNQCPGWDQILCALEVVLLRVPLGTTILLFVVRKGAEKRTSAVVNTLQAIGLCFASLGLVSLLWAVSNFSIYTTESLVTKFGWIVLEGLLVGVIYGFIPIPPPIAAIGSRISAMTARSETVSDFDAEFEEQLDSSEEEANAISSDRGSLEMGTSHTGTVRPNREYKEPELAMTMAPSWSEFVRTKPITEQPSVRLPPSS